MHSVEARLQQRCVRGCHADWRHRDCFGRRVGDEQRASGRAWARVHADDVRHGWDSKDVCYGRHSAMKRSLKWAVIVAGAASVLAAGFVGGRAWAGGVPSKGALTYSGMLQNPDGTPLASAGHNLEIKLWSTGPTGGSMLCDTAVPAPTFTLDSGGRFSVQLDDACTGAIGANAGAFVEVLLDGNTLGRTKLGAVPYALEANHAATADSAATAATANSATTAATAKSALTATTADSATTAATANSAGGALAATISALAQANAIPKVSGWTELATGSIPKLSTPSGQISNVTTAGRWRRVGDSLQLRMSTNFGGVAPNQTGQMVWNLPAGVVANVTSATRTNVGPVYVWSNSGITQVCQAEITTALNQLYAYCSAGPLTTTSPISPPASVEFDVTFPVQGWTVTQ